MKQKALSLNPLPFDEAVTNLLKVPPPKGKQKRKKAAGKKRTRARARKRSR